MNNKITPKDFFLHLGATIALYAGAIALINLAFSVINYLRPDVLAGYFYAGSVAWPISMLIIIVPILYLLEWLIARDIRLMPEKKDLWIRRWRIFLTLFLAVILIGGDLIALLNTYFSGEITSRFVYKVIVILLVAGCVGKYYFFSLYENFKWSKMTVRFNAWFGIVLVLAAIISGFYIVGSPAKQRNLRFDSQRVSDLSNIQWRILDNWQRTERLPASLAELSDPLSGTVIPVDPSTKQPYEYNVKGMTSFELCANFALPSQDLSGRGAFNGRGGMVSPIATDSYYSLGGDDFFKHEAGRTCFARNIDPERFPPYPKERVI